MQTRPTAVHQAGPRWRHGLGVAVGVSLAVHVGLLGVWLWGAASPRQHEPVVIMLAAQAPATMQVQWLAAAPAGAGRGGAAMSAPSPAAQGGARQHVDPVPGRVPAQTLRTPVAVDARRPAPGVDVPAATGAFEGLGSPAGVAVQAAVVTERGAAGAAATSSAAPALAAEPARPVGPQPLPGNTLPGYPLAAREDGLEGRVLLRVQIDPAGAVAEVAIVQRSGVNLLDQTARDAVRAWRFRPANDGHVAVPSSLQVAIRFSLREPAPRMELALAGVGR